MKRLNRVLLATALLAASFLGGYVANLAGVARVQAAAAQAGFAPHVKITLLDVPNVSTNPDIFGTTAVKITDVGTFTVENQASLVEVTHNGRLMVEGFISSNGAVFELRVDNTTGLPNNNGAPSGTALVRAVEANQYVFNSFTGYWKNLSPGTHTVSIWVRSSSGNGDNALVDPGGWQTNQVIVKEYLPFGATSLPLISR